MSEKYLFSSLTLLKLTGSLNERANTIAKPGWIFVVSRNSVLSVRKAAFSFRFLYRPTSTKQKARFSYIKSSQRKIPRVLE